MRFCARRRAPAYRRARLRDRRPASRPWNRRAPGIVLWAVWFFARGRRPGIVGRRRSRLRWGALRREGAEQRPNGLRIPRRCAWAGSASASTAASAAPAARPTKQLKLRRVFPRHSRTEGPPAAPPREACRRHRSIARKLSTGRRPPWLPPKRPHFHRSRAIGCATGPGLWPRQSRPERARSRPGSRARAARLGAEPAGRLAAVEALLQQQLLQLAALIAREHRLVARPGLHDRLAAAQPVGEVADRQRVGLRRIVFHHPRGNCRTTTKPGPGCLPAPSDRPRRRGAGTACRLRA